MNIGNYRMSVGKLGTLLAITALSITVGLVQAKPPKNAPGRVTKVTQAERQAAADAAAAAGFTLQALGPIQNGVPHYFSHPNYANSPLPEAANISAYYGNDLLERAYASDYPVAVGTLAPAFVIMPTPLPAGTLTGFQSLNQAAQGLSPFPSAGNIFHAYVLRPTGTTNQYTVAFDSGELIVPALTDPALSETAGFPVADVPVEAGDLLAFYGQGIPLDTGITANADILSYPVTSAPVQGATFNLGIDVPLYSQDRSYSFGAVISTPSVSAGIRKFVDGLPGLGAAAANSMGQFIPVGVADTTTYANSDYYEIAVLQYREKMHSDLPGTLLRGYVQLTDCLNSGAVPLFNDLNDLNLPHGRSPTGKCGLTAPHYLGPAIVATKDKPVRVLFRNLLPTGVAGNLFIPTDTTVMGSGKGPDAPMGEADPQRPECGMDRDYSTPKPVHCYTENRATLHLHGGISPWISDGTPHQWTTPARENTNYKDGVSVEYVPDMWFDAGGVMIEACAGQTTCDSAAHPGATNNPGEGAITFYWTNQQSARLMFYHDHAWGITRLNVLAGEAAAYIIQDDTELSLVTQGLIPGAADTIPLVLQDKTYVPSRAQLDVSDELWDEARWGGLGNLWLPHVYSPAQNPGDSTGVNQFGRWAYGPWFWPPTSNIDHPPIQNAYYDPNCNPSVQWCEPLEMPGTPINSMGMEAYHDTPIVNGTAYPTVTLEPKPYRLRFLNAASDRFFNLSIYKAVDANGVACDPSNTNVTAESTGVACTEVLLNPAEVAAALADPAVFPTPDATMAGPSWIQIGTEGGFLPAPVEIPAQPITWVTDPTVFNAGNVDQHSLLIGPAERADTIVDFSAYAGMTLILYNDAPAAFPARDPRYDYYTGNNDLRDTGGAPSTLPGYGPNTRTVMQIKVSDAATTSNCDIGIGGCTLGALATEFAHHADPVTNAPLGVFETGQHPIIVGQAAYNSAYGEQFASLANDPDGFARITDFSMNFDTLSGIPMANFPFQPKAIQDEMGEAFEKEYGRMSGNLGLEVPLTQAGVAQNLILYPYVNPASELINATLLPLTTDVDPLTGEVPAFSDPGDGTQIWKITHNGVDTHPIHFHLFDVQLINRVGWDGIIRAPDANELGWKDTVRISPLEDTIVALRPIIPVVPFDLPNSIRPLNPMMPLGDMMMFNSVDADGNPTNPIMNTIVNFGWEYVWHCHILSHEEMDMMRPISVGLPPLAPSALRVTNTGSGNNLRVTLNWTDNSKTETGFIIQRSLASTGPWTDVATLAENTTTYSASRGRRDPDYFYQVLASNTVGYAATPGYSTMTLTAASDVATAGIVTDVLPAAPSGLTGVPQAGPSALLNWTDNSGNETGFVIERALGTGAFATVTTVGANVASYTDITVAAGNNYQYRVAAANGAGLSAYSNTVSVNTAAAPAAPGSVSATAGISRNGRNGTITVNWNNVANETGYTIQVATDAGFTSNLSTNSVGADTLSYTYGKLARGIPYYVRVLAFNGSGTSAWTNAAPFPVITP